MTRRSKKRDNVVSQAEQIAAQAMVDDEDIDDVDYPVGPPAFDAIGTGCCPVGMRELVVREHERSHCHGDVSVMHREEGKGLVLVFMWEGATPCRAEMEAGDGRHWTMISLSHPREVLRFGRETQWEAATATVEFMDIVVDEADSD